ncbi:hypothetical protein MLD38_000923 [Melastoma candidum]|uniref:Uncharacterized protein n=1 Tax=Melastoma candidum TaxID=119954 RepID=A0ACB9SEX9_9MYRT|nr:hypothetical protein MLD38_000923 [Melastoma candidum]
MGVFFHEEEESQLSHAKTYGCLTKALKVKEAFSHCHNLSRQVSCRNHEDGEEEQEGNPLEDPTEEQEAIVSEIRSRAIEKLRHKYNHSADGFSLIFSSTGIGELQFFTIEGQRRKEGHGDNQDIENEEFASVKSFLTCCSSVVASREVFFSAKSNLSRSSSLNDLDNQDLKRRLIFRELCHCEGWPFGLCRKLLYLPPLPKSPTESWSWRKRTRVPRTYHHV